MTFSQIAQAVVEQKQCHVFRPRLNEPGQYDAKAWGTGGRKKGWTLLDSFSASAVCAVYNAINDENKAKLEKLPPVRIVSICFKLCGGSGSTTVTRVL